MEFGNVYENASESFLVKNVMNNMTYNCHVLLLNHKTQKAF